MAALLKEYLLTKNICIKDLSNTYDLHHWGKMIKHHSHVFGCSVEVITLFDFVKTIMDFTTVCNLLQICLTLLKQFRAVTAVYYLSSRGNYSPIDYLNSLKHCWHVQLTLKAYYISNDAVLRIFRD